MPSSRAPAAVLWVLAACVLLYYALTPGLLGSKAQGDGWRGFHVLPALALHQTLDLRPVVIDQARAFDRQPDGRLTSRNPIGPALAMLPVYTLTLAVELLARALFPGAQGLAGRLFDINLMQLFWTGLVTTAAGLLGMAALYRLLRRHVGELPALLGSAAALLTTPLLWYLTIEPHYQHGLAFAAVTLLIERWDATRCRPGPRRALCLGLLGGLAMLMRPQEAVFLLAPAAESLAAGALADLLVLGLGAILGVAPQGVAWLVTFGAHWPPSLEPLRPLQPALAEVLFSMRGGLFPWCPTAYLGLAGLLLCGRRLLKLAAPLALVFAADVYLVASSWVWHGAFGYGCRRLSDCAPILALGLAILCRRALDLMRGGKRRRLVGGAAAAALVAFVGVTGAAGLWLVDLMRRQALPSSAGRAMPAYLWAARAGAPGVVVRLLRSGDPFVQPAGWIFARRHRAPPTAWESVVGNYVLEREAHTFALMGDRVDLAAPESEGAIVEGLLPLEQGARPVRGRLRLLLQPFASEPIAGVWSGRFARPVTLRWDGHALASRAAVDGLAFEVPAALVRAHRVSELEIECQEAGLGVLLLAPGPGSAVPARGRWLRGGP